jgi:hypothetical protein
MLNGLLDAGSGAQALATTCAARCQNLAAASGGEARAEAVTALAHQFAGLICPLHGSYSESPGKIAAGQWPIGRDRQK